MQRNLEALCRALESLDPEERSVKVKWSFRGFTASRQGMINFKETSDCSRVNERMEKAALFVSMFHAFFFVHVESEKWSENILKLRKKFAMNDCDILWLH